MISLLMTLALARATVEYSAAFIGPAPRSSIVVVSVSGIGYPPRNLHGVQARLMARRAAEVTAVRNLAAKLGLLPNARMGSFRYVAARNLPGGAVEVTVETHVSVKPNVASLPTQRSR